MTRKNERVAGRRRGRETRAGRPAPGCPRLRIRLDSPPACLSSLDENASASPPPAPAPRAGTGRVVARRGRREPEWVDWPDEQLLDLRLCDLGVRIEGTELEWYIERLYQRARSQGARCSGRTSG